MSWLLYIKQIKLKIKKYYTARTVSKFAGQMDGVPARSVSIIETIIILYYKQIIKTKVSLPLSYVTLADLGYTALGTLGYTALGKLGYTAFGTLA